MSRTTLPMYRVFSRNATRNFEGREERVFGVLAAQTVASCGACLAMGSVLFHQAIYLFAQVSSSTNPSMVPDALGTTVLTVGGGGLVVLMSAVAKDFWA